MLNIAKSDQSLGRDFSLWSGFWSYLNRLISFGYENYDHYDQYLATLLYIRNYIYIKSTEQPETRFGLVGLGRMVNFERT
jgi:hypothetical protein